MVKRQNGYQEKEYVLLFMDIFKVQDKDRLRELCPGNCCGIVIVPHNLTNKFQSLDISVNNK